MSSTTLDGRGASEERPSTEGKIEVVSSGGRPTFQYESTPNGDVVVVEPSFDAGDNDGRSPVADRKLRNEVEGRSSPSRDIDDVPTRKSGHTRNLSEHFQDATTLSRSVVGGFENSSSYAYQGPPSDDTAVAGQKHRRVFSGDLAHPAEAHRRINSIGNSAPIQRRPQRQERAHQRVDSAGLDILTAAADVSREELAAAAGSHRGRASWGGSTDHPAYDRTAVPPPSRTAPPPGHHRPYSHGPPPGYYSTPYPPAHYPHGPPPPYYPPHPTHAYRRSIPPGGYPVQYAHGPEPYLKRSRDPTRPRRPPEALQEPSGRAPPPHQSYVSTKPHHDGLSPKPPHPSGSWQSGNTQGVQTYVTAIGVSDGNKTLRPTHPTSGKPEVDHRKTSPVSNWAPPVYMGPPDTGEHPLKSSHHRATSSSISLLGFDVGALDSADSTFLKNLQASQGGAPPPFPPGQPPEEGQEAETEGAKSKLAQGGTSKRVRRKCTIEGCANRVVQGGLCIAHGAKRKQCKHPGCNKNVKKAGLCSTHGPARKRCEAEGCGKVAVQGGRCIAHGAKKKLCSVDSCSKQAILGGMCKKHHDHNQRHRLGSPGDDSQCKVIDSNPSKSVHKPTHTRGLSIFQDLSADVVGDLLEGAPSGDPAESSPATPGHRHQSTFSRDFGSLYR